MLTRIPNPAGDKPTPGTKGQRWHHCKSARFKSIQATARARRRLRWGSRCARRATDSTFLGCSLPRKLHCAEHDAAPRLGLRIVQADRDTPEACAAQILELAREQISQVDVLILDELGEAMRRGFVTRKDVEGLIAQKPATTELVLTGRGLLPLANLADLVTEMRPIKHYFDEGLLARQGIEY